MRQPLLQGCFPSLDAEEHRGFQKSIDPSPLRPQTTMAIEMVNTAAKEAQAKVNNMNLRETKEAYRLI